MMMKTAYVSSTYKDLKEHREAVYKALRKIRYDVICMEDYVATDERNVDKCCAHASGCDIYIGILAHRYGHIPEEHNPGGMSITEMEYRAARASPRAKVRAFLLEEDAPWPHADVENQASQTRLRALRAEVAQISYGPFRTVPELVEQVLASVYTTEAEARVGLGLDKICSLNQIPLKDSGLGMITWGIKEAIQTIGKSGSVAALLVDLGSDWWSTRLYLVAALLEDYTSIEQVVFKSAATMDSASQYLGMCSPADVRRALASYFRNVDRAYRESVPDRVFDAAVEIPSIVSTFITKVGALAPGGEPEVKQSVTSHVIEQWRGFQSERIELANRRTDGALLDEIVARRTRYVALVRDGTLEALIDRAELATNLALRRH
jgi:Domain of unknown function (DUF4062)